MTHYRKGMRFKVTSKDNGLHHSFRVGEIITADSDGSGDDTTFTNSEDLNQCVSFQDLQRLISEGDVLVNEYDRKVKILGICGQVYFVSKANELEVADQYYYTAQGIEDQGYKILDTTEEVTEVTLDQIAEKFGVPVSQLKVKKGD